MDNLLTTVVQILAENGETRTLTLLKMNNNILHKFRVLEPLVFDYIADDPLLDLPISVGVDTHIRVSWGDGDIEDVQLVPNNQSIVDDNQSIVDHEYSNHGVYRVKLYNISNGIDKSQMIVGGYPNWADHIKNFISIGRIGIYSLTGMFHMTKFNGDISPNWDTANIISLDDLFARATSFNKPFGKNWNTTKVTSFNGMFRYAVNFNQTFGHCGGELWDTSNVTDLSYMFYGASSFNQPFGFSKHGVWNTSKVTDMSNMFDKAVNFNQIFGVCQKKDKGKTIAEYWDTSNVVNMSYMFNDAKKFNQPFGLTDGGWNIQNVASMKCMFSRAEAFNQPFKSVSNWDLSSMETMECMFLGAKNFQHDFSMHIPGDIDTFGMDVFLIPKYAIDYSEINTDEQTIIDL